MRHETQRLIVRPYTIDDFAACKESLKQRLPDASPFDRACRLSACRDIEEFEEIIKTQESNREQGHLYNWGLFLRGSGENAGAMEAGAKEVGGEYVGDVNLLTINKQLKWGNLGILLQNQFHGKGLGKEACLAAIAMGFNELGYHRIETGTDPANAPAIRLITSLGLVEEGIRRKFFPEPESKDMLFFATNAIDWQG